MGADPEKARIRKGREGRAGCTGGPDASIMVALFSSVQNTDVLHQIYLVLENHSLLKGGWGTV